MGVCVADEASFIGERCDAEKIMDGFSGLLLASSCDECGAAGKTGRHLYGGAQQVLYLLKGLRAEGVRNVLVSAKGSAISRATTAADRCVTLPMRGDLDAAFMMRFRRLLEADRPDIVHLHSRRGADVLG